MNIMPTRPRGIYLLPNLFTIASIFSGFFSIIASHKGLYEEAAIAIFIAMIMDNLDGRIARLTNTMTAFGAQFDSMADMVSFAVAPAFLAYTWGLHQLGKTGWIAAFIYTAAVALRLARFNTQADGTGKRYFQGLPCPMGAAMVSSFIWFCIDLSHITTSLLITLASIIMVLTALLMVSNIRYRSFKDVNLKNHVKFVVILITVTVIALVSIDPEKVLFVIFTGYIISGPVATIWELRQKRLLRKKARLNKTV
jgi:CDP-diacylglycerol--serine O-phosphatidyltransferase